MKTSKSKELSGKEKLKEMLTCYRFKTIFELKDDYGKQWASKSGLYDGYELFKNLFGKPLYNEYGNAIAEYQVDTLQHVEEMFRWNGVPSYRSYSKLYITIDDKLFCGNFLITYISEKADTIFNTYKDYSHILK